MVARSGLGRRRGRGEEGSISSVPCVLRTRPLRATKGCCAQHPKARVELVYQVVGLYSGGCSGYSKLRWAGFFVWRVNPYRPGVFLRCVNCADDPY